MQVAYRVLLKAPVGRVAISICAYLHIANDIGFFKIIDHLWRDILSYLRVQPFQKWVEYASNGANIGSPLVCCESFLFCQELSEVIHVRRVRASISEGVACRNSTVTSTQPD